MADGCEWVDDVDDGRRPGRWQCDASKRNVRALHAAESRRMEADLPEEHRSVADRIHRCERRRARRSPRAATRVTHRESDDVVDSGNRYDRPSERRAANRLGNDGAVGPLDGEVRNEGQESRNQRLAPFPWPLYP